MKHLFLVDPDPTRLCILDVSLRRAGYDVTTASDGAEALDKIVWEVPDLVITDALLPQLDGFALLEHLKADPSLASLPVLFLASERSKEDQQRASNLGVDDYLTRPVSVRELIAHVELLLARRARESVHAPATAGRGGGNFVGSTRDLAIADLLQNIESAHESGVAHVRSGLQEAHIFFRDGRIVDGELGPLRGREAVYRVLMWEEASFHVEFKPVPNKDVVRRSTRVVVMEGMRQVDDWMRLYRLVQPLADLLGVSPSPLLERLRAAGEGPDGLKAMPSLPARPDLQGGWQETHTALLPSAAPPRVIVAEAESATPPEAATAPATAAPAAPRTDERSSRAEEDGALADFPAQHNMPSEAPWARELSESVEHRPEDEALAAGVPRRMGRAAKRVTSGFAAVAVVLAVVFSLRAQRARQQHEAETARGLSDLAIPMAAAAPAPPRVPAPPEAPAGAGATSPSAAVTGEAATRNVAVTAEAESPAVALNVGVSAATPAMATAPARETALLRSVEMHAASPAVRDAQRLLLNGETGRATALAQTAVSDDSSDADAWLTLAASRKAAGDLAGANEAYRECIARARTVSVADCRALGLRAQGAGE